MHFCLFFQLVSLTIRGQPFKSTKLRPHQSHWPRSDDGGHLPVATLSEAETSGGITVFKSKEISIQPALDSIRQVPLGSFYIPYFCHSHGSNQRVRCMIKASHCFLHLRNSFDSGNSNVSTDIQVV